MTYEVGTIAHEIGNVLAVTNEVLAIERGAFAIATPVEHQELKTLIGERPLRLPLVGSGRQRTVHQSGPRSQAP
jgi:hypothetical protein